jgi:hypothetical protein
MVAEYHFELNPGMTLSEERSGLDRIIEKAWVRRATAAKRKELGL